MKYARWRKSVEISAVAINAALYATLGYMTYLGLFTPVIGVVRFWPAVIVPGFFSVVYGPLVGGIGAAIGIFISDLLIHGNALLSLTVGVPANFLGFYTLGALSRRRPSRLLSLLSRIFLVVIAIISLRLHVLISNFDSTISIVFAVVSILSLVAILIVDRLYPDHPNFGTAAVVGLALGSAIIGIGVWAYSQFLVLPTGEINLPIQAALLWFLWTFITEIPFLAFVVPPLLKAFYKAFPYFTQYATAQR